MDVILEVCFLYQEELFHPLNSKVLFSYLTLTINGLLSHAAIFMEKRANIIKLNIHCSVYLSFFIFKFLKNWSFFFYDCSDFWSLKLLSLLHYQMNLCDIWNSVYSVSCNKKQPHKVHFQVIAVCLRHIFSD